MQVTGTYIRRFQCLLYVILSKYICYILTDRKSITTTSSFNCKRNKRWIDKSSKFYNRLIKSWLQDNHIEIQPIHNEEQSVVADRFFENLKTKI